VNDLTIIEKEPGKHTVAYKNSIAVGTLEKDVDGYYKFWPTNQPGCWVSSQMRAIADLLDHINAEWDEQIQIDKTTICAKGLPEKDDFIVRLQEEKNELATKKYKLNEFLGSGKLAEVSDIQKDLLKRQLTAMTEYYACLNLRLYDLEQNKAL